MSQNSWKLYHASSITVSVDGKNFEASRQAVAMISNFSLQRRWRAPVVRRDESASTEKTNAPIETPVKAQKCATSDTRWMTNGPVSGTTSIHSLTKNSAAVKIVFEIVPLCSWPNEWKWIKMNENSWFRVWPLCTKKVSEELDLSRDRRRVEQRAEPFFCVKKKKKGKIFKQNVVV